MTLRTLLQSKRFVITTELNPPKGTELAPLIERAESLPGVVDAFNLTDSHTARMSNVAYCRRASAEITAEIISDIRPMCRGAHIMAIVWESLIPSVISNSHQ